MLWMEKALYLTVAASYTGILLGLPPDVAYGTMTAVYVALAAAHH